MTFDSRNKRLKERLSSSRSFYLLQTDRSSEGMPLVTYIAKEFLIGEDEASDLIDFGVVQIEGRSARAPMTPLKGAEEIRVYWPHEGTRRHYEIDPLRITYRDDFLLAYNKEAGVPSQQTPSDAYNNLFAALQRYLKKESSADAYIALHHRLDRETSGIILFSIEKGANRQLGSSFQLHQVTKDYLAWVAGSPGDEQWTSSEDIGRKNGRYCAFPMGQGKAAETAFRVLRRDIGRTLVWARPKTGRTHQIRLHLAAKGIPILGDRLYGKEKAERLFLHAFRMILPHPVTKASLVLTAPVPPDWRLLHEMALPGDMDL